MFLSYDRFNTVKEVSSSVQTGKRIWAKKKLKWSQLELRNTSWKRSREKPIVLYLPVDRYRHLVEDLRNKRENEYTKTGDNQMRKVFKISGLVSKLPKDKD